MATTASCFGYNCVCTPKKETTGFFSGVFTRVQAYPSPYKHTYITYMHAYIDGTYSTRRLLDRAAREQIELMKMHACYKPHCSAIYLRPCCFSSITDNLSLSTNLEHTRLHARPCVCTLVSHGADFNPPPLPPSAPARPLCVRPCPPYTKVLLSVHLGPTRSYVGGVWHGGERARRFSGTHRQH